jgi:hypothetical protein
MSSVQDDTAVATTVSRDGSEPHDLMIEDKNTSEGNHEVVDAIIDALRERIRKNAVLSKGCIGTWAKSNLKMHEDDDSNQFECLQRRFQVENKDGDVIEEKQPNTVEVDDRQ